MFEMKKIEASGKAGLYAELLTQAKGLLHDEHDLVANAANFSALLYHSLPDLNWVGFYFMKDGELLQVRPYRRWTRCLLPLRFARGSSW